MGKLAGGTRHGAKPAATAPSTKPLPPFLLIIFWTSTQLTEHLKEAIQLKEGQKLIPTTSENKYIISKLLSAFVSKWLFMQKRFIWK